jgi:PQQ-dependent dehydrogenase (s-GDH family)
MKNYLIFTVLLLCYFTNASAQGESFSKTVLNTGFSFEHPFDLFQGPDDSLWVSERSGRVSKVNKINGGRRIVLDIRAQVNFTRQFSSGSVSGIDQDGMFGMALHPDAMKGLGKDSFYVAYCYNSGGKKTKIVKFYCNPANNLLTGETILIQGLPASNDHNGGKLVFGPDLKIYYSCGDQGANQFNNKCVEIKAQKDISAAELAAANYTNYAGHILRLNTDGSVPADNPLFAGVRSHVYTKGHRNPQGLVWQKNVYGAIPSNGYLYSSEQGAVTDDEVNLIESGKNYGWPYIAGFNDNVFYKYYNYSAIGGCALPFGSECDGPQNAAAIPESSWLPASNYTDPMKSQKALTNPDCADWLLRPTVAWSSIEFYNPLTGIPGWSNSILLTTLKNSSIIRYKLDATGRGFQSYVNDTIQYFRSQSAINRFRDITVGSNGITLFVITDSIGGTSGVSAGNGLGGGAGGTITDRGKLIAYTYTGSPVILSLEQNNPTTRIRNEMIQVYPNPASDHIVVNSKDLGYRPYRLRLISNNGTTIFEKLLYDNLEKININQLPSGQYLAVISNRNNQVLSKEKIIVAK